MMTSNVYFGKTTQRFLRALRTSIDTYASAHPILSDVHVGFKKLPSDGPQKDKQVIIQPIYSEDGDNKFIRWQTFGISCYAKSLTDVEDLAAAVEGVCSVFLGAEEGIRYVDIVVSYSETENSFSTLSRNQSTIEDWRLMTVEVSFTPVPFITAVIEEPWVDSDGDSYSDEEEWAAGSDPYNPDSTPDNPNPWVDSDGDSYSDEEEWAAGSDPYDPNSTPDNPNPGGSQAEVTAYADYILTTVKEAIAAFPREITSIGGDDFELLINGEQVAWFMSPPTPLDFYGVRPGAASTEWNFTVNSSEGNYQVSYYYYEDGGESYAWYDPTTSSGGALPLPGGNTEPEWTKDDVNGWASNAIYQIKTAIAAHPGPINSISGVGYEILINGENQGWIMSPAVELQFGGINPGISETEWNFTVNSPDTSYQVSYYYYEDGLENYTWYDSTTGEGGTLEPPTI